MAAFAPTSTSELEEAVAAAAAGGRKLEIRGGGSKSAVGRPDRDHDILALAALSGVVDYDPAELVLTVRAGTPLAQVLALVAGEGQMLAFEPFDQAPLVGATGSAATIGGVVAAAVAGPRRLSRGGARDHLLGFEAVSGRGESFVAGGKVVKNVTGYDLPKLAAGSWGRLMALTSVTLKVLPAPREMATRLIRGLTPEQASGAMARALGSQAEVAAAAHVPGAEGPGPLTLFRLEGFAPSVVARCGLLEDLLGAFGMVETPTAAEAGELWQELVTLVPLAGAQQLWRIVIPARRLPELAAGLEPLGCRWLADWGGGLVWVGHDGRPAAVREAAAAAGGHAALFRAPPEVAAAVPTFHPLSPPLAALEQRVRLAFDPGGVFETGRFGG